jgi:hypothetical protein
MAASFYNRGLYRAADSDVENLDIRVLILAGASVPGGVLDVDLNTVADVLGVVGAVEAAVAGYSRKVLPGLTLTEDDTLNWVELAWTNVVYTTPAIGETWRAGIFYVEGASDAARDLLFYDEFAAGLPTNGQNITYSGGAVRFVRP